ncbi:MAG: nucleotide sugar dehydrogenase [Firmicutes bacterium]|nr:nucleotide sugar dehydrogenase [Bacillota bacterium]
MKLSVTGLGYIGLPTAAMFAKAGLEVVGVDKNTRVVDALNRGTIVIHENGLAELVKEAVESGRLRAVTSPEEADVFIIAVPTPITEDKKADMRFVAAAAEDIAKVLKKGDLVILESTSPAGTCDELLKPILEKSGLRACEDFSLGHSPERVIPGHILEELVNNDRVAGGCDDRSTKRIKELYSVFVKGNIYETNARTAEMCKLAENTFRDVNIAFANELAKICESQGINVWELISICNRHPRVNIHQPGPGVGGHCIAVDPWFIVEKEPDKAKIIDLARHTNDGMPEYVANKADEILKGKSSPRIAILGATYKPDVDDMRESPIMTLAARLRERGCEVMIHDPFVKGREGIEGDVELCVKGSDLVILGVNHSCYRELDLEKLAALCEAPRLLDTRNFIDRDKAERAGFEYHLLGRRD